MTQAGASPWLRHLMAAETMGEGEGTVTLKSETVMMALAVLMLLMLLILQCVCKENSSPKEDRERKANSKRNGVNSKASAVAVDASAVVVDMPNEGEPTPNTVSPGETPPVSNGVVHSGRNGVPPSGHSRNASSGSGQMRPTSLRELPDLPVGNNHKRNLSGAGGIDASSTVRTSVDEKEEDSCGYDHLGAKITTNSSAAVNYDHINLESPRDQSSGTTPQSEADTASEGHYAQVRERTYDVVKDVRARASAKVISTGDYDPYAKVKDEEDDREDPYAKVKDTEKEEFDDDYAHLKHDHVIVPPIENATNTTSHQDDEDPYERVIGDSAGARVISTAAIPDPDDPYSLVWDQASTTVVSFSGSGPSSPKAGASSTDARGSKRNNSASSTGGAEGGAGTPLRLQYADEEGEVQDDYATVVKDRNLPSTSRMEGAGEGTDREREDGEEIQPYFTTPPEPPRLYGAGEVGRVFRTEGQEEAARSDAKEHRYTKVTARESLASMSARNALNTYEVVPDLPENTYATVDGGSGDGVVRYATPGTPNMQHSASEFSETYAEIGASGSGSYAVPAPEPPSLDSLHSMTKSTSSNDGDHGNSSRPPASPGANVIIAEDGYAVVSKSGFSPSETALPQIPRAGTSSSIGSVGSLGEEKVISGVTLHPDYHSVKDSLPDQDNENDPNYESVDEALSKSPAASSSASTSATTAVMPVHSSTTTATTPRVTIINHTSPARVHHQYEEVSPPASPLASSVGTSPNRVLIGAAAANAAPLNGTSSSGETPKGDNSENAEAAEVRDRVLQGHMYEDISEVKKRKNSAAQRADSGKKQNTVIHSVKL